MRKGISLPINLVVILAIAVLVLVVVAAFFILSTSSGFGSIATEQAYATGCQRLLQAEKCDKAASEVIIDGYNPTNDPANREIGDTLLTACRRKFSDGTFSDGRCKQTCGCR